MTANKPTFKKYKTTPDPEQARINAELIAKLKNEVDGKDHINIYSRGSTELGQLLSHFSNTFFNHPVFGPFDSMEGFWYYMRSKEKDDQLRYLSGYAAKKYGRVLEPAWYDEFWEDVLAANYQKVIQNPHIKRMLMASTLPFQHYYLHFPPRGFNEAAGAYRGSEKTPLPLIILPRDHHILVQGMEEIRQAVKEDRPSKHWEAAQLRYAAASSDNISSRTFNPEGSIDGVSEEDPE